MHVSVACRFTIAVVLLLTTSVAHAQGDTLRDPPSRRSSGGVLNTSLTVAPASITVAGVTLQTNLYEGLYAPPTLRLQRGDLLNLRLTNNTDSNLVTNVHYHGWTVSPQAGADDVFVHIPVAASYQYSFQMPANHSQGMYWYHPHPHFVSERQVLGGMSGALIVEGLLESNYPQLVGIRERVMLLKDIQLPTQVPKVKTVNGQFNPVMNIAPGELQFWRIGNVGADSYMNLYLGGQTFYVIAVDGNVTTCMDMNRWRTQSACSLPVTKYLLPPSSRVEVVVIGPAPGVYPLLSDTVDTGPAGDPNPRVTLATLISGGSQVRASVKNMARAQALKTAHLSTAKNVRPTPAALRAAQITARDTLIYSENDSGTVFKINGKTYDPSRNDTYAHLGDVIEFTIINQTQELHTFHLHQTDYLVTEVNGQAANSVSLQDNVNLPYMTGGSPGVVKVLVPFFEPGTEGKFVYHCHILEHEDAGMMATLVLLPPDSRKKTTKPKKSAR